MSDKKPSRMQQLRQRYLACKHRTIIDKVLLVLAGIIATCIFFSTVKTNNSGFSRTVDYRLHDIGELSTQAAYFTNVQVISNSRELFGVTVPFTQNKYVYSYDGTIKAGIDFTKVTVSRDPVAKVITIGLPAAYITSVSVDEDSLVIYDEVNNIFTPLKLDDFQSSRKQMETEAIQQASANGLLVDATENAKTIIKAFLLGDGDSNNYEIVWVTIPQEE